MTIGRVYTVYKKDDHVTQTNPYVDLSRTKGEAKTYTDDKESLLKKSEKSNKKNRPMIFTKIMEMTTATAVTE